MKILAASCLLLVAGCALDPDFEKSVSSDQLSSIESELTDVPGCYFYVGSNYGGQMLWMERSYVIGDLHAEGMGDKISSLRLVGGATTQLYIDKYLRGSSWYITSDVSTLHTSSWGNLGDNASSAKCF